MVLWNTRPPSSLPAGFPNKVAVPWPRTSSLDLLACFVCEQYELGLHNTTLALPTLSLIIQVSIYPAPPRPDKAKIRSSGRKAVSRAASEHLCQLLQQNKNPVGARPWAYLLQWAGLTPCRPPQKCWLSFPAEFCLKGESGRTVPMQNPGPGRQGWGGHGNQGNWTLFIFCFFFLSDS